MAKPSDSRVTPRARTTPSGTSTSSSEAGLAENSDVRGCMVIKPHGYAIWEKMQRDLDDRFKDTGHVNAYFPLFIPSRFLAQGGPARRGLRQGMRRRHALPAARDGRQAGSRSIPTRSSKSRLIIRPTSETIIWNTYKNWIQSYRDLPLLINQWATSSAGRCARGCSCAPPSSSGRRATPPTPPQAEAGRDAPHARSLHRLRRGVMAMPVIRGPKTTGRSSPARSTRSASRR